MELLNVKGTFDYLPNEMIIRNEIINKLKKIFEEYGFFPLETSTLCYYDLLASKYAGGAEILKEVYTLKDQGDRKLGLRYDLTVPFAKIIAITKGLNLPFRRYEIGKVFRDGPVKVGRNREFYQCDIDVCGINGEFIEVELMTLVIKAFSSLSIDINIKWNNRKLLSGLVSEVGFDSDTISDIILSVDKLDKIGEDGVKKEISDLGVNTDNLDKLFNYFKMSLDDLNDIFINSSNSILIEGINEARKVNELISDVGISENTTFAPYLARGLEIYTGIVFEFFDKKGRITSSLGAGGRYDRIITNFINDGNMYPAVGLSFGLEPIYEIIKENYTDKGLCDLFIIPLSTRAESLVFANRLRDKGLKVLVETEDKKLKNSMQYANTNKIKYVIVLGENEINESRLTIKNMEDSTTKDFDINDIDSMINYMK